MMLVKLARLCTMHRMICASATSTGPIFIDGLTAFACVTRGREGVRSYSLCRSPTAIIVLG